MGVHHVCQLLGLRLAHLDLTVRFRHLRLREHVFRHVLRRNALIIGSQRRLSFRLEQVTTGQQGAVIGGSMFDLFTDQPTR